MKRGMCFVVLMVFAGVMLFASGSTDGTKPKAPFEERYKSMTWKQIVAEAKGQTIYWHMWGGNDAANKYVTGYLAGRMKNEYGVTLNQVPVPGPQAFMNAVLGEQAAGKNSGGSVDVMWINGANFYKMKNAKALFGPYTSMLPNLKYTNWADPSLSRG